jgi:hypothetical protein
LISDPKHPITCLSRFPAHLFPMPGNVISKFQFCSSICRSLVICLYSHIYMCTDSNDYIFLLLFLELKLLCRIAEMVFSRGDVKIEAVSVSNLATLLLGKIYMCTCIHIYICVFISSYMFNINMCISINIYMSIHAYICLHVCKN